jgi:Fe-S cluster assembly iron-binding protein IscA
VQSHLSYFCRTSCGYFDRQPDFANAAGGYAVGACLIATWWLMRGHARYQANFLNWLVENRDSIKAGKALHNGMLIVEQTEVTQFQLAISALVISLKTLSRFYGVGEEEAVLPPLAFTASSLIVGWWGAPHGPIYTIQAVSSNLRGGERRRVGDLIDELRGHDRVVVQLTERAAENARRIISEREYPPGTALQVEVTGKRGTPHYSVCYDDRPPEDGSVWKSESHGVPVIVRKEDARRLAGLAVDFAGGEYTFKESAQRFDQGESLHDVTFFPPGLVAAKSRVAEVCHREAPSPLKPEKQKPSL